jgi:hypothetical protein
MMSFTPPAPAPPAPPPVPATAPVALPETEDPGTAVAFALGWQVAELYSDPHHNRPEARPAPDDLPGIGRLTEAQRTDLGLRQIDAGLHRLLPRIELAGLTPPDTGALRAAFEDSGGEDLRKVVLALHTDTLKTLTAADFRLGKAYGLGRAMRDTVSASDDESLARRFDVGRIRQLDTWLADLDSALPAHASSSVRMSLGRWQEWAARPAVGERPLDWQRDAEVVRRALYRQAQRWRALLSGEKAGVDMLTMKDYLAATQELLSRAGRLVWGVLKHLWFVVLIIAALITAAVVLLATSHTTSGNIAAIAAFAAALGVTWQGVGGAVLRAASRLEAPLWGAALNVAIFEAITRLPGAGPGPVPGSEVTESTDPRRAAPSKPR